MKSFLHIFCFRKNIITVTTDISAYPGYAISVCVFICVCIIDLLDAPLYYRSNFYSGVTWWSCCRALTVDLLPWFLKCSHCLWISTSSRVCDHILLHPEKEEQVKSWCTPKYGWVWKCICNVLCSARVKPCRPVCTDGNYICHVCILQFTPTALSTDGFIYFWSCG